MSLFDDPLMTALLVAGCIFVAGVVALGAWIALARTSSSTGTAPSGMLATAEILRIREKTHGEERTLEVTVRWLDGPHTGSESTIRVAADANTEAMLRDRPFAHFRVNLGDATDATVVSRETFERGQDERKRQIAAWMGKSDEAKTQHITEFFRMWEPHVDHVERQNLHDGELRATFDDAHLVLRADRSFGTMDVTVTPAAALSGLLATPAVHLCYDGDLRSIDASDDMQAHCYLRAAVYHLYPAHQEAEAQEALDAIPRALRERVITLISEHQGRAILRAGEISIHTRKRVVGATYADDVVDDTARLLRDLLRHLR